MIDLKTLLESQDPLSVINMQQLKPRKLELKHRDGQDSIHSVWMLKQHIILVYRQGTVDIFDKDQYALVCSHRCGLIILKQVMDVV